MPDSVRQPDESNRIARELLATLAALQDRVPAPEHYDLWARELADIAPAQLRAAGDRLLKTWRSGFLPMPGDVRAQIEDAERKGLQLSAEAEWQRTLRFCTRGWHPDIGYCCGAKSSDLSAIAWHALRAAGGVRYVHECSSDDLVWAKKRFLEEFTLAHETRKVQHLITAGDAQAALAQLGGAVLAEKKALGPGLKTAQVPEATNQPGLKTAQVTEGGSRPEAVSRLERRSRAASQTSASAPETILEFSEEELQRRKREAKQRLAEWAREHGMSTEGICETTKI